MIDQQIKSGRPMTCSFVVLAKEYKAIHDAETKPAAKIKIENNFRKALMALPEFEPVHSRMIISYLLANPNNYTPAQRTLILNDHINYLISKITPESRATTLSFLESLLPSNKRAGKLGDHPALAALIQTKILNFTPAKQLPKKPEISVSTTPIIVSVGPPSTKS
jgi:hypothetical protein